jgi:1,4-dihydroxy-2-naphthoyl-CoA hydrolase
MQLHVRLSILRLARRLRSYATSILNFTTSLSGGASLALAENVAGIGSLALCPGQIAVGINVSGTHVLAVSEGDIVTAFAKIVHKGRTLHTWQVDIKNTAGEVICTVQVTNYVFTPKKDNQKKGAETKV